MKRTLQVDLITARAWYNSNNETLKQLSLQVFTEEELSFSYEQLALRTTVVSVDHSAANADKARVLEKLAILANHFNGKITGTYHQVRYFISERKNDEIQIGSHESLRYPGIVYFKKREHLKTALQEFTDTELDILFS